MPFEEELTRLRKNVKIVRLQEYWHSANSQVFIILDCNGFTDLIDRYCITLKAEAHFRLIKKPTMSSIPYTHTLYNLVIIDLSIINMLNLL